MGDATSNYQLRPVMLVQSLGLPESVLWPSSFGLVHTVDDDIEDIGLGPARPEPDVPINQPISVLVLEVFMPSLGCLLLGLWAVM